MRMWIEVLRKAIACVRMDLTQCIALCDCDPISGSVGVGWVIGAP
jgi:hypothetical protein